MNNTKNPIFIEYYSHTNCDCYKLCLPWSVYKRHIMVLCPVSEGLEHAELLAIGVINKHLTEALLCKEIEHK